MSQKLDWALTEIKNGLDSSMPKDRQKAAEIVVEELQSSQEQVANLRKVLEMVVPCQGSCKCEFCNSVKGALAVTKDAHDDFARGVEARVLDGVIAFVEGKYVEANSASDIGFNGALGFVEEFCLKSHQSNPQSKGEKAG